MLLEIIGENKLKVSKILIKNQLGFLSFLKNHSPICGDGVLVSYFDHENQEFFYGNYGCFHFYKIKFIFATLETSGFNESK